MGSAEGTIQIDEAPVAGRERIRYRNPIFDRELKTLLRSPRAFVLLAVYVALTLAIMLASYPRGEAASLLSGQISRELFALFALAQTILLGLLVPAAMGGAMTREKEVETIDLLLTTPLSADQILLGKLLSGLAYFMILVATSTPLIMLCYLIGGILWQDVAGLYLFLGVEAALFGLTSLTCSVFMHRTHSAIIVSYLLVGGEAILLSALYGDGVAFLGSGNMAAMLLVAGLLGASLYAIARVRVCRPFNPVRKAMEEEDVSRQVGLIIRRDQFPDRLIAPPRRTQPIADGVNPVLDKELQAEIYGSGSLFVRLVIQFGLIASFGAFLWVLSGAMRGSRLEHPEYPYFCFLIMYVLIVGPSLATTTFTQEKEFHTMESLALTLVPRTTIVLGKFMAILRVVGALAVLNSTCFLIAVLLSSYNFDQILALAITVGSAMIFSVCLGMFLSLHARTTTVSTIATYFLVFTLLLGPALAKVFLTRFMPSLSEASFAWLDVLSPFLACYKSRGAEEQFITLGVHALIMFGISGVLLWLMTRQFERVVRSHAEKC
jgi:ABC-type transport system involved in multi-copper enzyme maturation permease subunit